MSDDAELDDVMMEPDSLAGPDLFATINTGLLDGFLVDDLGWAIFSIREALGIEHLVALATTGTAESFFEWVQQKVGVALGDWEPVKVTLFQAWITITKDVSSTDLAMSYRTWSANNKHYGAVAIRPVDVFAIRHRAWRLLQEDKVREFHIAMQRSHLEARWARSNPGRPVTPEDMNGDAGYVIAGRRRGMKTSITLTWPAANLVEVIREAQALKSKRVADLVIFEASGVGIPFNARTAGLWDKIATKDERLGNSGNLLDMARSVGIAI